MNGHVSVLRTGVRREIIPLTTSPPLPSRYFRGSNIGLFPAPFSYSTHQTSKQRTFQRDFPLLEGAARSLFFYARDQTLKETPPSTPLSVSL